MKIFLTGGTGFLGSNFIDLALNKNYKVLALRRSKNNKLKIKTKYNPIWINSSFTDIRSNDIKDCDIFVHLASYNVIPPYESLQNCLRYNLQEPLILFETARKAGIKKYIVAGSCFEYGNAALRYQFIPPDAPLEPTLTYSVSKAAASISLLQWATQYKLSMSIRRIFHLYGEGEDESRFYPSLVKAAITGKDFNMTKGEQVYDFINVKQAAESLLESCEEISQIKDYKIKVSNLGTGKPKLIRDFAKEIWNKYQSKGNLNIGSIPYRNDQIMRYVADINSEHIIV